VFHSWTVLWDLRQLAHPREDILQWRVIDIMHAVYEGVCKNVVKLLLAFGALIFLDFVVLRRSLQSCLMIT